MRTPDSQAPLMSPNRSMPPTPLPAHVLPEAVQQLVRDSLGVQELSPDVAARAAQNAELLRDRGFTTPEAVRGLLKSAFRHDAAIAVGLMGLTGNAGYAIGMEAANEKLVAMLPAKILQNPSQVGMIVGLGVGGLDVMISVLGKAVGMPLIYNGAEGNSRLPESIQVPGGAEAIMESMKLATGANFLKNAPRIAAPGAQALFENAFDGVKDGTILRITADRADVAIDAGLGFAASAYVQFKNLTGATGYDARMLLRSDLGDVLDKMQGSYKDSLHNVGSSVKSALTQPAVPLAVAATIGMFISQLFAANSMIDNSGHLPGLDGNTPADRANWGVMTEKRMSSVMLMALMTATIEIGAPIVAEKSAALWDKAKQLPGALAGGLNTAAAAVGTVAGAVGNAAAVLANAMPGSLPNIGGWAAQMVARQPPQHPPV